MVKCWGFIGLASGMGEALLQIGGITRDAPAVLSAFTFFACNLCVNNTLFACF